jgi:hypothetical protein
MIILPSEMLTIVTPERLEPSLKKRVPADAEKEAHNNDRPTKNTLLMTQSSI